MVQRRVELLVSEGIEFQTGVCIGRDISATQLLDDFDAVVLCLGSTWPRDLSIPGMIHKSSVKDVHFMKYPLL